MTLTATYSPDDNKLRLYSLHRLDPETYGRVKAAGFAWAAKQDLFVAPMWTPAREDLLLELCGEIGDEDTSLCERAEQRADRFEDYRDKRAQDAERAHAAVAEVAQRFEAGQPILVGHHSQRKAEKDAQRIEAGMRRAVNAFETSQYWKSRAAGAIAHAKYKERPDVRARRIKGIEADQRKALREIERLQTSAQIWHRVPRVEWDKQTAFAKYIAGRMSSINLPPAPGERWGPTLYGELDAGRMHGDTAWRLATAAFERAKPWHLRWIAHYENRLTYERAMLNEQGASSLLEKAPRPKPLPLVNYRAPEGITIPNMYQRGEMIHYPQVEMTSAEYAAKHSDYKCTRVVGNSHRVRCAMVNGCKLVTVFLTDSKVHPVPAAVSPRIDLPEPRAPRPIAPADPAVAKFDALKTALKTGVQVVSAPQLFPTPPDLAARMIEAADIRRGMLVLEPSAGTGRLLDALPAGVAVLAVEINPSLAEGLRARYPHFEVICQDFTTTHPVRCYDRIVMNPPFGNAQDVEHIKHALRFLKPGGRLVALCAAGSRQRAAFEHTADWEDLPAGSFASEGTGVNVAMITMTADETVQA